MSNRTDTPRCTSFNWCKSPDGHQLEARILRDQLAELIEEAQR